MFNTSIGSGSKVVSKNNRTTNSGNTNIHVYGGTNTFNPSTSTGAARTDTREGFDEFQVPVKLPFQKNPNFCGREDILDTLQKTLHPSPNTVDGNVSGRKTAILHGMGGVGKSQIALEYAHRYSDRYTSIFWIDADDQSRVTDSTSEVIQQLIAHYATKWRTTPDYAEIANTLGIPGKIDESGRMEQNATVTAIKALHNWLGRKENGGWLLLIDNKDSTTTGDSNTLYPTCNWGSIIITSRLSTLTRYGRCIEVEGIGAEAGLSLMLKSSGINEQIQNESELTEARKIVSTLGEIPLALDQAASYIRANQIFFSGYRKELKEGMAIFKKGLNDPSLSPYKASVLTTWELSFQALHDDARELLRLCAFLSNEDIPFELFYRGKEAGGWMTTDKNRLQKAVENLFTFSMAKRKTGDSFWIHSLVHTWARERTYTGIPSTDSTEFRSRRRLTFSRFRLWLTFSRFRLWLLERSSRNRLTTTSDNIKISNFRRQNAEDAIALVASTIVTDNQKSSDDWIFERRILSHLNACQRHISEYFTGPDNTLKATQATWTIGEAFNQLGFLNQAEELYQIALAGYEKALGSDHPSTLDTVHNMASVFDNQGRYEEALEWYRRSLAGKEKALGSDHPSTLDTVHNMALVFDKQGRYEETTQLKQKYKL